VGRTAGLTMQTADTLTSLEGVDERLARGRR